MIFFTIVCIVLVFAVLGFVLLKKNTGYFENQQKPKLTLLESYEQTRKSNRKGELGEFKIDFQLQRLPENFRSLSDLLIETPRGLTQIDHVIISPVGIFVIETKNFSGQIFGKQYDKVWTQVFYQKKNTFYNPIRQNYGHIQALKGILKRYQVDFYSIISFTRRCELRVDFDLRTIKSPICVIYDTEIADIVERKAKSLMSGAKLLDEEQINDIFKTLENSNIIDAQKREQHLREVKMKKRA